MTATLKPTKQPDGKSAGIESSAGFGWMILFNTSSPGGHVWSEAKERSLCGIEKRFPYLCTEVHGTGNGEFEEWWKNNSDFCCRTCASRYKRSLPNTQRSDA
jgi:hypothetical protein